jgi:hypothetical protein
LGDILILDIKVLTYNAFITYYGGVLVINDLEVFTLLYLGKGDHDIFNMDNTTIKLQVVIKGESFTFLGQELGLYQSYLLLFNEGIVFNKERIVNL